MLTRMLHQACKPRSPPMAAQHAKRNRQRHHAREDQRILVEDVEQRTGCSRVRRQRLVRANVIQTDSDLKREDTDTACLDSLTPDLWHCKNSVIPDPSFWRTSSFRWSRRYGSFHAFESCTELLFDFPLKTYEVAPGVLKEHGKVRQYYQCSID